jgi:predicted helicase
MFNHRVGQMPNIFPATDIDNFVITVNAKNSGNGQIALITNTLPDLHSNGDAQCFPMYLYDEPSREVTQSDRPTGLKPGQTNLFAEPSNDLFEVAANQPAAPRHQRRDALTDAGLVHFQTSYPGQAITKEDVFYYIYGLLHSPEYRARYADNLSKELPRIPCVKAAADFWTFSQAGRQLAELHLNYETVEPFPATISTDGNTLTDGDYRVEKMKYGKKGKDKDLTTLHYNAKITLTGIPLEAHEYVVNGKPALDWVVERQCVKTDKDSGIVNDANDWANETMVNPRYPLELFQRVITVSLETMQIVKALPALDI